MSKKQPRFCAPNAHRPEDVWRLDPTSPSGLVYKMARGKRRVGEIACGTVVEGYHRGELNGRKYRAHRVVFFLTHGWWPAEVDHIDGNGLNNAPDNLRAVDKQTNMHNRVHRGINQLPSGNWNARISVGGQSKYLGTFPNEHLAHAAYLAAKSRNHPTAPERCYV